MSSAREAKKGLRAKAKASLKGLTIDTSFTQHAHNSENVSIPVGGSSNGGPAMMSGQRNRDFQEKAKRKGLTIDTKLTHDAHEVEITSATFSAKLARKPSIANMPRLSEAMLNTDWRNHRRAPEKPSPAMIDPLWTAPPEQSKFPDYIKDKPQRDDEDEVFDYDRGLERVAYRCSRPDEVKPELIPFTAAGSVSAELCLSAPATKLEFSEAEIGGDERSKKYDPSVFQPSIKSIVRLDTMAPIKRAGYEKIINWNEEHVGLEKTNRAHLQESSSIATITPVNLSSSWESVEFPYAEIRAVKGDRKFETGLSDIEETVRMQLAALVEPQTAGLPPDYLRKEYEELREERRKATALANSTVEARVGQGDTESNREAADTRGTKDTDFNVLLGRLNKLCAPRLRAYTVGDKNDFNRPKFENEKVADEADNIANGKSERSPSKDSAISGLASRGRTRSSTLNPQAMEFRVTTQEKQSLVADVAADTAKASSQAVDPIQRLETRVAELEAQLAQQHSKKGQPARQRSAFGGKRKQPFGAAEYGFAGPRGASNQVPNNIMPGAVGYQSLPQPIPPYQAQPGLGMVAGGMHLNPMPATAHYELAGNMGFPMNGMPTAPTAFNNPYNTAPALVPFQGHGGLAETGPSTGTPLWVKSVFGPKPVSKPNRPFQPGDGVQAMRQQQYEEYLEHLRATDPSYALRCKQRQARRADRQRGGVDSGMGPQKLLC